MKETMVASAVRNRCPYPSGRPASSVKIEEGKSTEVPVCGMVFLVHLTGCAETVDVEAASAKAESNKSQSQHDQ
jgi:hypothetical protein